MNKSNVSNGISFIILTVGLVQTFPGSDWLLAAGLFGFAGGITNWLAIKMLFDRVPLLYGSGVIPRRFQEIREEIRDMILLYFLTREKITALLFKKLPDELPIPGLIGLIDIGHIHRSIGEMLDDTLQELTPDMVKKMTEDMIREHLGWLIVWGNIFGAGIGLASHALGY